MTPLTDGFGRPHTYLRIAVTDRCNLRCVYCMPAQGIVWKPRAEILSLEEILRLAELFTRLGIEKIRLTGGEPTVRHDLPWLVERLAALPGLKKLAMTTNGVLLAGQAQELRDAGLQAVNISLDTLRPDRFQAITLRDEFAAVWRGIDAALAAGFEPVKLNVVVMAGVNDDELTDFVELGRDRPLHVRFIEFMPFPGNPWQPERYLPWRELQRLLAQRYELQPLPESLTRSSVARTFHIPDFAGTVSFISPLSEEFCGACNRLRLTADGAVKSCLLYPAELSLRDALRAGATDTELEELVRAALARKDYAHPAVPELLQLENRCMTAIGG